MSGFGPPRFPQPFPFGNNLRFPQMNPRPQGFSPGFRPRHPQGFDNRGGPRTRSGFVPGQYRPRGRFQAPYGEGRPHYGQRGRGQGHHGNKGFKGPPGQGQGKEAYYKHSMVEDPWKGLEETLRKQKQEDQDT